MYLQDFIFLPLDRVHERLDNVTELLRQTAESQHSSDQGCLRPAHHNTPISPQLYELKSNYIQINTYLTVKMVYFSLREKLLIFNFLIIFFVVTNNVFNN